MFCQVEHPSPFPQAAVVQKSPPKLYFLKNTLLSELNPLESYFALFIENEEMLNVSRLITAPDPRTYAEAVPEQLFDPSFCLPVQLSQPAA